MFFSFLDGPCAGTEKARRRKDWSCPLMQPDLLKKEIVRLASSRFIDQVRFIDARPLTADLLGRPEKFIGRQPTDILPSAKSVIVFTIYIGKFAAPSTREYGRMSRLVFSGFYKNIVKELRPVQALLEAQGHRAVITDEAAEGASLPMKAAAVKAGLGWIGKNTLLNSQQFGTFRALGAILTDADLAQTYPRAPMRCGSGCTRCLDACPVQALHAPREIVKTECLSYILGKQSAVLSPGTDTDGYFFECEICQNICPWNQKHIQQPLDTPYGRRHDLHRIPPLLQLDHLMRMDEETYNRELAPLMAGEARLSYALFQRNLHTVLLHRNT